MALNVQINGVERREYARYRTLRIHKDHAIETCRIEFIDMDSTSGAFRPTVGDELRVDQDGVDLEFGGEVTRVEDRRIGASDIGTVTVVEARGWFFEAAAVRIPLLVVPAQDAYITLDALIQTYMAPKGWTSLIGATGGDVLPALVYAQQTIGEIIDDIADRLGDPWRVNGDREFAVVPLGSLLAPVDFTASNATILRGATWTQDRVRTASRLFIETGGAGQYLPHQETHAANGVKTHFPVNVLPPEIPARINNAAGYAIGVSSIAFRDLPSSATLRAGTSLRFASHLGYASASAATSNGDGEAIIPISPSLTVAVVDGEVGVFGPEASVAFEVGGTPVALAGAPWSYDPEQALFSTASTAPTSPVTYRSRINLPAVVRTWSGAAQSTSGAFDFATVTDALVSWPMVADVAVAKADGDAELSYRAAEPKTLTLATYEQGIYPWMVATCTIAARQITGSWLIQSVTLTDTGRHSQRPRLEITLREGATAGRNWRTFWRLPVTGASRGGGVVASGGASGGGGIGTQSVRIPLGGDNYRGDNVTDWTDVPNAVPLRFGGAAMAGTWTLRVYRRVIATTSPVTTVEVRLRDLTNAATLATVSGSSSTTFVSGTQTFSAPGTEGVCVLQYRVVVSSGTPAEARVGQCTLEFDA